MSMRDNPINVNISTLTIVKTFLFFLLLYFFYLTKDILMVLFVSLILSSALEPSVAWMESKKIPRSIGVLIIYLLLLSVVGAIVYLIVPIIIQQTSELLKVLPGYFEKITSDFHGLQKYSDQYHILSNIKQYIGSLGSNFQNTAGSIFSTVSGIFGGIISFFMIMVITFYMCLEENAIKGLVLSIAPTRYQTYLIQLINRIQKKIGWWLRGQLILSLAIFVLDYVGLMILGVDYALVLALIAGLTEFIPYVGPVFATIPAVFLAFTQSPMLALFVGALYYIVQMVENNILVPKIMERAVGLSPIISIIALLVGFNVGGIVGAILAIPVATALTVIVKDMFERKDREKEAK